MFVHCEMCGYLWKSEEWTPESVCPTCAAEANLPRELAWLEAVWGQLVQDERLAV